MTRTHELFDVTGRTAIVTGATSGIGARFADTLVGAGVRVVAIGRNERALADLTRRNGEVDMLPVVADVTHPDEVERAVANALEWAGQIDFLVNAAGITVFGPAVEETPADFVRVMDTNVNGMYFFCHFAGRHMVSKRFGSIVNVASINGTIASGGEVGYCASKGAVLSMTRELAAQWAEHGVRVNALSPGYFPSEMTASLFETEAGLARMSRSPIGRPGAPHELDGALLYLLSPASSFVTGQSLVVDGGLTII